MNQNSVPKYSKVELLLKGSNKHGVQAMTRLEFFDCGLMITGDYIVVVIDEKDDIQNSLTSTGEIFHMSEVSKYKTHAQ